MRMDQFMGLPSEAIAFLKEHEVPQKVCPECCRPFPRKFEVIGHYVGMFEEYPLYRHILKNGQVADEFLQAVPWDCGPMHYLGLRTCGKIEFTWPEEEIL